jgi:hypothetical protein
MKKYEWEQDQIKHMKDYIARFGHGSAKLARQAQSKEKTLAKMERGGLTEKVCSPLLLLRVFPWLVGSSYLRACVLFVECFDGYFVFQLTVPAHFNAPAGDAVPSVSVPLHLPMCGPGGQGDEAQDAIRRPWQAATSSVANHCA